MKKLLRLLLLTFVVLCIFHRCTALEKTPEVELEAPEYTYPETATYYGCFQF